MDTSKINPFVFLLFPFLFFSNLSFASIVDLAGSGATWLRDTNSENLMRLTPNSSAVLSGNNLTLVEKVNIPTSKGLFAVDFQRTAAVDINRVGKAVGAAARSLGPVSLGLTAASLICELTTICNQAGEWFFGSEVTEITSLTCANVGSGTVTFLSGGFYNKYKIIPKNQCGGVVPSGWGIVATCSPSIHGCAFGDDMIKESAGSPVSQAQTPRVPTSEDWSTNEPLLNDSRFISTLLDKNQPVPVQAPSITIPQKFPIGNQTTTLKDGNGNTTGTQTTTTEAEITTPSAAENPSGSPSVIRITETSITNNYNINNELTSSTTTTTGGTEKPQQQSYEIEIDNVNPDTLQEKPVSFPFDTNSWGSGSCPADRTVNYHYGSLNLTFQPACDYATGIKPIVLILAGFVAMYIISGAVRDA